MVDPVKPILASELLESPMEHPLEPDAMSEAQEVALERDCDREPICDLQ
jgi:hypothetical protein